MKIKLILVICILTMFIGCSPVNHSPENTLKLWYDKPASIWEEDLPVGNGRCGAMVYGRTGKEFIQFNEEMVWAGKAGNNILPAIKSYLPAIPQLIFEGKYNEAQDLANKYLSRHAEAGNNCNLYYTDRASSEFFSHSKESIENKLINVYEYDVRIDAGDVISVSLSY